MKDSRTCSHTGLYLVILLLILGLGASLAMNAGLLAGRAMRGFSSAAEATPADEKPDFKEIWSWGEGEVKAVRIPIQGALFRETPSTLFGPKYDPIESVLRQIRAAQSDPDVRALLLEVSSPGGEVTAADEIRHAVETFKKSAPDRKVVAFVQDMAASGGYYLILPADRIVAERTAMLGSIGVILQTLNWKGLSERLGVTDTTIKVGEHKDMLNPFHDVPPEQIALLQDMINVSYRQFFEAILAARGLPEARLREVADGRVFDAELALRYQLVDSIGYWGDALNLLRELLGVEELKLVRYEHIPSFSEWLATARWPVPPAWSGPLRYLAGESWPAAGMDTPRPLYLWRP